MSKSKRFDTLTVNTLIVGDADGQHVRINKGAVEIHDKSGISRIKMAVEGNGSPYLQFADSNGNPRITLHVTSDGEPCILLHNSKGQTAFAIQEQDNRVSLDEADEQGRMGSWLRSEVHRQAEHLQTERETAVQ